MSAAQKLERTAFATSRLLDFVSQKELTLQCGYGPQDWALVAVKELLDNALDACEEQGIAPEITVTVGEDKICVADNGAGIRPEVVDQLLDFSVRVSSREAYVAPDRGAQGNALKTIVAMPFVLDGEEGRVDIVGGGVENRIAFSVDRIQQRPVADVERFEKDGSLVRINWPAGASSDDDDDDQFLQEEPVMDEISKLCVDFALLNPHLTLTLDANGSIWHQGATDPGWVKWRPSSPTSPHWYEREHLERLLGAYITHELQTGYAQNGDARTVREFVEGFRGMTSTRRQAMVLKELDLARSPLTALLSEDRRDFDHELVGRLLAAMKDHTSPPRPQLLGVIGRDHIEKLFSSTVGIRKDSFEYKRSLDLGKDGLPQVTEIAFAARADEQAGRWLTTGVNWSAAWVNPFRQLGGYGNSLDAIMESRKFDRRQPIVLLVHAAHPRVQYSDRGKSTVLAT